MQHPLETYPGYLLRRAATARMSHLARRLEPLGVMVTEASILVMIGHNPGISQAECGRSLAMARANMNPLVRRMVERGWLDVLKGRGRAQGLQLTAGGTDLVARISAVFESHEEQIFAAIPEESRAHLMPILRALHAIQGDPLADAGLLEDAGGL